MILLAEEEIGQIEALGEEEGVDFEEFWMHEDTLNRIAKAQLKKVVEWLNKRGYIKSVTRTDGSFTDAQFFIKETDWQALLEEVRDASKE